MATTSSVNTIPQNVDTIPIYVIKDILSRNTKLNVLREYKQPIIDMLKNNSAQSISDIINNNNIITTFIVYIYLISACVTIVISIIIVGYKKEEDIQGDSKIALYVFGVFCLFLISNIVFFNSRLKK